jgi:hypothetical protein
VNGCITLSLAAGATDDPSIHDQTGSITRSAEHTHEDTKTASQVVAAGTEAVSNAAGERSAVSVGMMVLVACVVNWISFH